MSDLLEPKRKRLSLGKTMTPLFPELVIEVLARLPSKSVLRFKSLSKRFCSEIDDPNFVKLHLRHSLESDSTRALVFRTRLQYQLCEDLLNSPREEKFLTLAIDFPDLRLCCSCNGLVVLSDFLCKNFVIWNPNTGKKRILPGPCPEDGKYAYSYGLGYDPLSDDYKLVWIVQFFRRSRKPGVEPIGHEVWVYSFRCDVWRHIGSLPRSFMLHQYEWKCVVAHNALHFMFGKMDLPPEAIVIVAFDLHTEQFRQLAGLPSVVKDPETTMLVKVFGGQLSVVLPIYDTRESEVWTIKDYGGEEESWTKLVRLRLPAPSDPYSCTLEYSENLKEVLLPRYWRDFEWLEFEKREMLANYRRYVGTDKFWCGHFATLLVDSIVSVG